MRTVQSNVSGVVGMIKSHTEGGRENLALSPTSIVCTASSSAWKTNFFPVRSSNGPRCSLRVSNKAVSLYSTRMWTETCTDVSVYYYASVAPLLRALLPVLAVPVAR